MYTALLGRYHGTTPGEAAGLNGTASAVSMSSNTEG
jgi:hypothetical protein